MCERRGTLVSKDDLVREVWPDVIVSDDSLAHCVSDIRRALGPQAAKLLRTMPRRGTCWRRRRSPLPRHDRCQNPVSVWPPVWSPDCCWSRPLSGGERRTGRPAKRLALRSRPSGRRRHCWRVATGDAARTTSRRGGC
ncbi:MAG: winged helix-turn-helix domain-containing protein [Bauldia litoralis]